MRNDGALPGHDGAAGRRGDDPRRRRHAPRAPHAGPRLGPPLLLPRGGAGPLHRRPDPRRLDDRDPARRRRPRRLPRLAPAGARSWTSSASIRPTGRSSSQPGPSSRATSPTGSSATPRSSRPSARAPRRWPTSSPACTARCSPALHPVARLSVLSHLQKLEREGRIVRAPRRPAPLPPRLRRPRGERPRGRIRLDPPRPLPADGRGVRRAAAGHRRSDAAQCPVTSGAIERIAAADVAVVVVAPALLPAPRRRDRDARADSAGSHWSRSSSPWPRWGSCSAGAVAHGGGGARRVPGGRGDGGSLRGGPSHEGPRPRPGRHPRARPRAGRTGLPDRRRSGRGRRRRSRARTGWSTGRWRPATSTIQSLVEGLRGARRDDHDPERRGDPPHHGQHPGPRPHRRRRGSPVSVPGRHGHGRWTWPRQTRGGGGTGGRTSGPPGRRQGRTARSWRSSSRPARRSRTRSRALVRGEERLSYLAFTNEKKPDGRGRPAGPPPGAAAPARGRRRGLRALAVVASRPGLGPGPVPRASPGRRSRAFRWARCHCDTPEFTATWSAEARGRTDECPKRWGKPRHQPAREGIGHSLVQAGPIPGEPGHGRDGGGPTRGRAARYRPWTRLARSMTSFGIVSFAALAAWRFTWRSKTRGRTGVTVAGSVPRSTGATSSLAHRTPCS